MKLVGSILILGLFLVAFADTPVFNYGQYVYASGNPIDVGYYGSPFSYDWDGDGVRDLIVGQFSSGMVRFYRNNGTNANPAFGAFSYIQADGRNISVYAS